MNPMMNFLLIIDPLLGRDLSKIATAAEGKLTPAAVRAVLRRLSDWATISHSPRQLAASRFTTPLVLQH